VNFILFSFLDHTQLDTSHSVGFLWKSDQPDAKTSNLTTRNTHNKQTSMPLAGFEPAIPASERPPGLSRDPFTLIYVYLD